MPMTITAPEDGVATAEQQRESLLAALTRERDGYIARGKFKRVKDVETEMARLADEVVLAEGDGGPLEQATIAADAEAEMADVPKPKPAPRRRASAKK